MRSIFEHLAFLLAEASYQPGVQVELGSAIGLSLGVGDMVGSGLDVQDGLEALSLGSRIGSLQQGSPMSDHHNQLGQRCMAWLTAAVNGVYVRHDVTNNLAACTCTACWCSGHVPPDSIAV